MTPIAVDTIGAMNKEDVLTGAIIPRSVQTSR